MVPVLSLLRSRILTRVAGSSTALGMTVVAGCAPEGDVQDVGAWGERDIASPVDASSGSDESMASAPTQTQTGDEASEEFSGEDTLTDIDLEVEVGDLSRFSPMRVTVFGAPSLSEVQITIGAVPTGTLCILAGCLGEDPPLDVWVGVADDEGVVEFYSDLGDRLLMNMTYAVQAKLLEAPTVHATLVGLIPQQVTCPLGDLAEPLMNANNLQDGDVFRVVVPMPAAGSCVGLNDFQEWQAHDMLVNALGQLIPAPLEVEGRCRDLSLVESCMYTLDVVDPTAVAGGGGGGGGGGWAGRPFLVDGQNRIAGVVRSEGWSEDTSLDIPWLDDGLRGRLAEMYAQDGQHEHASVATFARLTLELMALGAPATLVQQATQAQLDEVIHAKLCFGIASAFQGVQYSAGAFDLSNAFPNQVSVEKVLVAAVIEGCIQETISSAHVSVAATRCRIPSIAKTLERIAEDETRHAELSWDTVRWLLSEHPECRDLAREAFESYSLGEEPEADPLSSVLSDYGQWSDRDRYRLSQRVMVGVVGPAAQALLG